jgi:hypothetical protein
MINKATPEEILLEYLKSLKKHKKDRKAVFVHLSALSRRSSNASTAKVAKRPFQPLLKKYNGQLYEMTNGDLFCALHKVTQATLDEAVFEIRIMYREDENLKSLMEQGREESFCTWYNIEDEYNELVTTAKIRLADPEAKRGPLALSGGIMDAIKKSGTGETDKNDEDALSSTPPTKSSFRTSTIPSPPKKKLRYFEVVPPSAKPMPARSFSPEDLVKIKNALATADLEEFIIRQPIELVTPDKKKAPVFGDRFIPLNKIQEKLMPGCALDSDPWLVQWLREYIDKKAISYLGETQASKGNALASCVPISLGTFKSESFQEFHKRCGVGKDHHMILEFPIHDILANIGGFLKIRQEAQDLGYRICIGRLNPYSFCCLNRDMLGADFEKITWDKYFVQEKPTPWYSAFCERVQATGPDRVILCGCNDLAALEFGLGAKMLLFQGKYIETL